MRRSLFAAGLLGLAASGLATSWMPMLDVEVYERSDSIVTGVLREKGEGVDLRWIIEVDEVVKGPARERIEVVPNKFMFSGIVEGGMKGLFCTGTIEGKTYLFHPACLRPVDQGRKDMAAARKLLDDPATAILAPDAPADPNIAFVIGKRYETGSNTWQRPVTRKQAMAYLRRCLDTDNAETLAETVKAIRRTGDRSLEPDIIERLDRDAPRYLIESMVQYLEEGGTERGIRHLEKLLRDNSPGYPEFHHLADPTAQAIGRIGHEGCLPVLEAAAEHGVQRAVEALSQHGTIDSFDLLYRNFLADESPGSQPNAMHWLVRRSNRQVEPWMHPSSYSADTGLEMRDQWRSWHARHRPGMRIVRDFHEARKQFEREREKP